MHILMLVQARVPSGVLTTIERFSDFLLSYAAALAAVGALSMALIEAWKKLWDSRTKFQALRWVEWVKTAAFSEAAISQLAAGPARVPGEPRPLARSAALAELLQLTAGIDEATADRVVAKLMKNGGRLPRMHILRRRPEYAVFALDLDRMMGAIQEAADISLASPKQYPSLYVLMTSGADRNDIRYWFEHSHEDLALMSDDEPREAVRERVKQVTDSFARLQHAVKAKLNGFQLYTRESWAGWNQLSAILVGFFTMLIVMLSLRRADPQLRMGAMSIVAMSALGGMLSPIAKDLVSALKRVKDG